MKKIDWNAPMAKKEWAVLCGITTGGMIILYGICYALYKIAGAYRKYKERLLSEQVQEEDEEPYFDDEE